MIKVVVVLISLFLPSSFTYGLWAVSEAEMKRFQSQCVRMPSISKMESEIRATLHSRRSGPCAGLRGRNRRACTYRNRHEYVDIDGFRMRKPSKADLEAILRMTTHNDAQLGGFFEDKYTTSREVRGDTLYIRRTCHMKVCRERAKANLSHIFNLNTIPNSGVPCADAICATNRIFGKPRGTYILYAQQTQGLRLSRYSDVNADPDGFKLNTLRAVMAGAQTTPDHLHEHCLHGKTFYKFLKGYTHFVSGPSAVANADGAVFDPINDFGSAMQMYIIAHEIGHRAAHKTSSASVFDDLDRSDEWLRISGFEEVDDGKEFFKTYQTLKSRTSVSDYGDESPFEDFAETYAMYRFAPNRLRSISPERYNFMRDKVFDGIQYTADLCNGSRGSSATPASSHKEKVRVEP